MFFIETERLKLIPLNYTQLLLLRESREALERSMGLNPSNMVIEPLYQHELLDALDNFWLPKIQQHPDHYEYYTNWEVIIKAENVSAGGIGIGYPDENGESVTGYCIDKQQHNKGYATEALKCLCEWGFTNPAIKTIWAETPPDNCPSQRILIKAGFSQTGTKDSNLVFKLPRT
ncbi:GNAT family N-acetyltransferase [Inquilinus sp. KBS0705]|nr:GNAT family N-acetyltransferase [Inquilinus sp. KBS0705]